MRAPERHRGFALPLTLIVLALLTTLAFGIREISKQRIEEMTVRAGLWELERNGIDALHTGAYQLITGERHHREVRAANGTLPVDGTETRIGETRVSVRDLSGYFSLVGLDPNRLRRVLELVAEPPAARRIAMEFADWVDGDDETRFQGAERSIYAGRRLPQRPRNAPARSVDELLELPSMTPDILYGSASRPGLADYVVAGGAGRFNMAVAPRELIAPVLGVGTGARAELDRALDSGEWGQVERLIDPTDWVFGGVSPFAPGTRFLFTVAPLTGDDTPVFTIKVALEPFDEAGPVKFIDSRIPDYYASLAKASR